MSPARPAPPGTKSTSSAGSESSSSTEEAVQARPDTTEIPPSSIDYATVGIKKDDQTDDEKNREAGDEEAGAESAASMMSSILYSPTTLIAVAAKRTRVVKGLQETSPLVGTQQIYNYRRRGLGLYMPKTKLELT